MHPFIEISAHAVSCGGRRRRTFANSYRSHRAFPLPSTPQDAPRIECSRRFVAAAPTVSEQLLLSDKTSSSPPAVNFSFSSVYHHDNNNNNNIILAAVLISRCLIL
uniref:Uncharacterized protein n=1 Tax=Schizaphis graminum TaxID=13262 RepID=A0A2S2NPJ9_SCHGA